MAAHITRQIAVPTLICLNSANQTLYQALTDRADSYPSEKIFHKLAFNKAANDVAAHDDNLYQLFLETPLNMIPFYGPGVQQFIYDHIQNADAYQLFTPQQRNEYRERRTRRALAHCKAQVEMVALRQPILH